VGLETLEERTLPSFAAPVAFNGSIPGSRERTSRRRSERQEAEGGGPGGTRFAVPPGVFLVVHAGVGSATARAPLLAARGIIYYLYDRLFSGEPPMG
jgi:hypothetical protein